MFKFEKFGKKENLFSQRRGEGGVVENKLKHVKFHQGLDLDIVELMKKQISSIYKEQGI